MLSRRNYSSHPTGYSSWFRAYELKFEAPRLTVHTSGTTMSHEAKLYDRKSTGFSNGKKFKPTVNKASAHNNYSQTFGCSDSLWQMQDNKQPYLSLVFYFLPCRLPFWCKPLIKLWYRACLDWALAHLNLLVRVSFSKYLRSQSYWRFKPISQAAAIHQRRATLVCFVRPYLTKQHLLALQCE